MHLNIFNNKNGENNNTGFNPPSYCPSNCLLGFFLDMFKGYFFSSMWNE